MSQNPSAGGKSAVVQLSVMMFLQFFVWGSWYVSQTGYMNVKGMGGLIAWAYTVGPIAAIVSPFFLGMIADRFFASQKVLATLHLLGAGAMLLVPLVARPVNEGEPTFTHPYVLLLLAHMLCYMPTLALTTSLSMHNLASSEKQFPIVRVWGTIGWIAGNIAVGGNLQTWGVDLAWIAGGDKSAMQFYITGAAGLVLAAYALTLPHTPPPLAGKRVAVREILGLDALSLFAKPAYLVFIAASFLLCIPLAGYYNYARTFVEVAGFTNATMTMSFGQFAEIFFMLVMPLCFARLGVKWMLAVGMLAWVVRYGMFALGAPDHVTWMILGGVLLHGICYDFFFVTGMVYVDQTAPSSIRGQAQGLLVLVTQGLGLGVGAQVFGWLVGHFTPAAATPHFTEAKSLAAQALAATDGAVAKALDQQSAAAALKANAMIDWQSVWLWPSVFAFVILVAFVAAFRGRSAESPAKTL
ncbi:MAG: MFS transporter [Phycisphaerae bacterium]|nr:MAG: MFS transporter [Phycisphaerae bacterium]